MTLIKTATGYAGLWRKKGLRALHLSLRTDKRSEARARHDAIQLLVRQGRVAMLDQLRDGRLTIERVAAMVAQGEPLTATPERLLASPWGTVEAEVGRYLLWLYGHQRKAQGTKMAARMQLQRFVRHASPETGGVALGALAFDAVTSAMVEDYQHALIAGGAAPNTVRAYMGRVGALWRWAERQEQREAREHRRAPHPVYSPVDPDRLARETTARDRTLTRDEAERLLAATPEPLLAPVAIALFAGLRRGEVLHLRPDLDLDDELTVLRVQRQDDWRPKTRRSERVVPIAAPLRAILDRHLVRYASDRWLTPSLLDDEAPFHERTFTMHFTTIVRDAGLVAGRRDRAGVTFHTLRHTFASWLVSNGVDLYTVAQLLGDTLATVETTYAHLAPETKRAAIAKLSGLVTLPDVSAPEACDSLPPAIPRQGFR